VNPQSNGPPSPNGVLHKPKPPRRRWLFVAIALLILIASAYIGAFYIASLFGEPAVKSIDEIDPAQVETMAVLAINRPDGGPDIAVDGKNPFVVPEADFEKLLAPLRHAKPFLEGRPIYLGYMQIVFRDGRKLKVMLHRIGDGNDPAHLPNLRVSIGKYQYEVSPLDKFLKPLSEVEANAKSRR
jgi:hypothetical protein